MKSIGNNIEGALATALPTLNTLESNDEDDFLEDIERTSQAFRLEETVSAVLASIDENKLAVLGHQFNDTVVKCSYRGIDCKYVGTIGILYHIKNPFSPALFK